ncbi:MAG: tetratricopeptide repeat protein [Planctomycetota bacterium]
MPAPLAALASRPRLVLAAVIVLVSTAYAPSLANGYALDDALLASPLLPDGRPNLMTSQLRPLPDYFTHGYWHGNAGEASPLYRPLPILGFAIGNALGLGALGHHLGNVVLHAVAVALAFLLARAVGMRQMAAILAAALFGSSAIHSEVVAGIVGRAELLAFCFGAVATLAFVRGARSAAGARLGAWTLASGSFALALFSKESALAWSVLALAGAAIAAPRATTKDALRAHALALLAVVLPPLVVFVALRHAAVGDAGAHVGVKYLANPLAYLDAGTRVRTGMTIWAFGLFKCLWPWPLSADYGPVTFTPVASAGDPRFLGALMLWLAVLVGAGLCRRRRPVLFVAAVCFVAFSLPVTNVLFVIGTTFGERLYFTPSLGIALAVAELASRSPPRWHRAVGAMLAAWMVVNLAIVLLRNGAWANDTALTLADAESNPRSVRVLDEKARHLRTHGDAAGAEALWRRVLELDPDAIEALTNYGTFLAECGRVQEAERIFSRALAVPDERRPLRHVTYANLLALYERAGRPEDARAALRAAWREPEAMRAPLDSLVLPTAVMLPADEALAIAEAGERALPASPSWPLLRAYVAHRNGDFDAAIRRFEQVLAAQPDHAFVRLALASAHLDAGHHDVASGMLRGLREDPRVPADIRARAAGLLQRK